MNLLICRYAITSANVLSLQIGSVNAQVDFAGLVEAGLYQINVHIPAVMSGDEPITLSIGDYVSQMKTTV